jgi:hypothetical protein
LPVTPSTHNPVRDILWVLFAVRRGLRRIERLWKDGPVGVALVTAFCTLAVIEIAFIIYVVTLPDDAAIPDYEPRWAGRILIAHVQVILALWGSRWLLDRVLARLILPPRGRGRVAV